jgi:molybdopterin biosynthesis enzyme
LKDKHSSSEKAYAELKKQHEELLSSGGSSKSELEKALKKIADNEALFEKQL